MRILMLSELYRPYIGGSEEYARNLAHGLHARGHEVSVATIGPPDRPQLEDDGGVRVHRLAGTIQRAQSLMPSGRPYAPPLPDPLLVRGLRQVIRREQPDIVHAHNWLVHSFLPLKRNSGAKLVMTLHDSSVVCAKRTFLYRGRVCSGPELGKCLRCAAAQYGSVRGPLVTLANWAMRAPLRDAVDLFVPVSQAVADENELARDDAPYEVLPNFVPDDVVRQADSSDPALAGLPSGPFWLYVGALSRDKGVHVLLDAYRGVTGAPPLVVVGRAIPGWTPDFPPDVIVLHDLAHSAVMAAWRRATVGFIPSLCPDSCPTVAIEAMACGVPVVASRVGGLPELVVHGKTGMLVQPGSVPALRDAMSDIVSGDVDLAQLAKAARRRAPTFMSTRVIGRMEQLYAQVAG